MSSTLGLLYQYSCTIPELRNVQECYYLIDNLTSGTARVVPASCGVCHLISFILHRRPGLWGGGLPSLPIIAGLISLDFLAEDAHA